MDLTSWLPDMPETRPISAVNPEVTATLKATADANTQRQAVNNQAMAQRAQEQLAREKMSQDAALSRDAMTLDLVKANMQARNYGLLNAKDMAIAQMQQGERQADRAQQADQFNRTEQLKREMHDRTEQMQKNVLAFQTKMAIADQWTDPEVQAELEQMNSDLMERLVRMEDANRIRAGKESDLVGIRARAARGIRETSDAMKPIIERAMMGIAPDMTIADISTVFDESAASRIMGGLGESALEALSLSFYDSANPQDEARLQLLIEKPETANVAAGTYAANTFAKAIQEAFPEANAGKIQKQLEQILLTNTPQGAAESVQQFQKVLSDNGVNPMVAGEIMRRMATSFRQTSTRLATEQGVTGTTIRSEITEDQVQALMQARIFGALNGFSSLAGAMPTMAPYDAWAATISTGDVNEVGMAIEQMLEQGYSPADVQQVLEAMQEVEGLRKQGVEAESDLGFAQEEVKQRGTSLGLQQERDRSERMLKILEEFMQ